MPSFNKIQIIGHLGRDPELRFTPDSTAVCNFSIATTQKSKKGDVTTWFKVTCFRNTAENVAKYLKKGSTAFVDGTVSLEEWTDREGNTRQTLAVTANDVRFLDGKPDGNDQAKAATAADFAPSHTGRIDVNSDESEDLPF